MRVHSSEFGVYSSLETANRLIRAAIKGRQQWSLARHRQEGVAALEAVRSMGGDGTVEFNFRRYKPLDSGPSPLSRGSVGIPCMGGLGSGRTYACRPV